MLPANNYCVNHPSPRPNTLLLTQMTHALASISDLNNTQNTHSNPQNSIETGSLT